jgi:demethylmenaquinone methyltransferase/2-methoxy-6-polyprenyl-1,4-benzoquinol methylase
VPVSTSKEPARIAGMFDLVAPRYDLLNHLLSGGFDWLWRRRAIRELQLTGRERVLDMCTGTADLAIAAVSRRRAGARDVVGIDFSGEMLRVGLGKLRRAGLASRVRLVRGDAMQVPLPDHSCDAATVAFGIRNVADPARAYAEFVRVLRPGGRLAMLEFGMPANAVLRGAYRWYFSRVLPRIGRLISRHQDAYTYLPASVEEFQPPAAVVAMLRHAGFSTARAVPLLFGVVYLYVADVPGRS